MKKATLRIQIFTAVCFLFIFSAAFSQGMMYELPLNEQVQNAQLIVEGKVVSKKSFWDVKRHNIYTVNTLEVYKVFKGELATVIQIVTSGGVVGLEMETVEPSLQLSLDDLGLFILNPSVLDLQNDNSSEPKYIAYASSQGFYKYDLFNNVASNPFNNKMGIVDSLYMEIQALTNSNYQIINTFNNEGRLNRNAGTISISSISPTTVTAGTATTVVITGAGFGATPGTVGFSDSNNGGVSFYDALSTQFISWSDTQIVVEVPDRAGTGNVRVVNAGSDTTTSGQSLTVSYAELNAEFDPGTGQEAYETQHINRDDSGGYVWQMQTDFDANTAANESFIRALDTWRCETEINWTIGGVTTTDEIANDDINIIRFDNGTELPNGMLGRCTSRWSGCVVGGTDIFWYVEELDIVFNDTTSWNFSTSAPASSQFDFETVAVHELGHGHQLGHVIDNGAIMHYSISNGSFNRNLSANDIAGGNDLQSRSTTTAVCGQSLMENFDCETLTIDSFELANQFNVYPSPANTILNIRNTSNNDLDSFSIYDINGRVVLSNKLNNSLNNTIQINTLSTGVYFIKIRTNGGEITKKFIKK